MMTPGGTRILPLDRCVPRDKYHVRVRGVGAKKRVEFAPKDQRKHKVDMGKQRLWSNLYRIRELKP